MPNPGDTEERFRAYYEAALAKGADPLVLLFVMVIIIALLVLGLKFWLDYRTKIARIRAGYSPERDEDKDLPPGATPPYGTQIDVSALKMELTRDIISEVMSPLLALIGDNIARLTENTTAVRELASNLVSRDKEMFRVGEDNTKAYQGLAQDTGIVKHELGELTSLFSSGYQKVVTQITEASQSPVNIGVAFLNKDMSCRAWNQEGGIIFGGVTDKDGKVLPPTISGASYNKGLGNNKNLKEVIKTAHKEKEKQVDILELSVPGTDEGKWNWYLLVAFPFIGSTLLLLMDVGDISRVELPDIVGQKKTVDKGSEGAVKKVVDPVTETKVEKVKEDDKKAQ